MTADRPTLALSAAAHRTAAPPITDLMRRALANPSLVSLAAGFVDQSTLPAAAALRAAAATLGDPVEGRRSLQYGTTQGDPWLRRRLAARLETEEGLAPGALADTVDRMVVTTGSQQLLYLVAEALLDPGDIVIVESPTYFVFLGLLESRGARAVGVETDEGGLRLDSLEATLEELDALGDLPRVKLIYTISEHSNPTGLSLAADRRGPLVALARRWSRHRPIFVLEDAAYRGLAFEGPEPPSVWSHDLAGDTVILARTFSKTLSPGLKTGFGVLPADLLRPVLHLKGYHDFGSGHFVQQLLDTLLRDDGYRPQIDRLVATYRSKRDATLTALDREFAGVEGVSWTHPRGGIYTWLTLPEGLDSGPDGPLFARCLEHGVLYVPGTYAYPAEPGPAPRNCVRICYGVPGEAELAEGIRRLAAAVEECPVPVS